jgi:hypothetical protein
MKRETAYKLALDSIGLRQKLWWTGHLEFLRSGDKFDFAVRDHRNWEKMEKAKVIIEKEI